VNGFGFLISLYSLDFHYLIFVIISMYLVGFGELAIVKFSSLFPLVFGVSPPEPPVWRY